jgi:hypothetical protein
MVKTVEPCDEKVWATVLSSPLMIVTTAITAVTPTTIPISVSEVRSLLARRLAVATRNASQIAVRRNAEEELVREVKGTAGIKRRGFVAWSPPRIMTLVSYLMRWSFSI